MTKILFDPESKQKLLQEERDFFQPGENNPYARVFFDSLSERWRFEQYGSDKEGRQVTISGEDFNERGELHGKAMYYNVNTSERVTNHWHEGLKHGKETFASENEQIERFFNKGSIIGPEIFYKKDEEGAFYRTETINHLFDKKEAEPEPEPENPPPTSPNLSVEAPLTQEATDPINAEELGEKTDVGKPLSAPLDSTFAPKEIDLIASEKTAQINQQSFDQAAAQYAERGEYKGTPKEKISHNQGIFYSMVRSLKIGAHDIVDQAAINLFRKQTKPDVILGFQNQDSVQKELGQDERVRPLSVEHHKIRVKDDGIYYLRGRQTAFVDRGEKVEVNSEKHALAAMLYAQQKWGAVEIKGTPEFIEQCIRVAAMHNIEVMNPELQERLQKAREGLKPNEIVPARDINAYKSEIDKSIQVQNEPAKDAFNNEQINEKRPDIQIKVQHLSPVELSGSESDQLMQELQHIKPSDMLDYSLQAEMGGGERGEPHAPPLAFDLHNNIPFVSYMEDMEIIAEADREQQQEAIHYDRESEWSYEPSMEMDI